MPTNRLSVLHSYVRMSWAPENLYNLARLSLGSSRDQHERIGPVLNMRRTQMTLFQQKWMAKRLLRAYHGDWIPERTFRRRFLPDGLPPLQATPSASTSARRPGYAEQQRIPLASLMWREVEARLDVLVFRACFAHSIYEARRLVLHGHVKLNGEVVSAVPTPSIQI